MPDSQPQAPKSMLAAVLLTIFFGPVGLLYASITGGLILLLIDVLLIPFSVFTFGLGSIGFLLVHIASVVWSMLAVAGKDKQFAENVRAGDFAAAVDTIEQSVM